MATNRSGSGRLRRGSTQPKMSMWDKWYDRIPEGQQDAPFATDENYNSVEQSPMFDNREESESDSDESSTSSKRSNPLSATKESKPWENPTQKEHLKIIMNDVGNFDEEKRSLRTDFSRIGLTWKDGEEEVRPWHFGLTAICLEFAKPQSVNIPMLMFASKIPFWLKLKTEKQNPIPRETKRQKGQFQEFEHDLEIDLLYGALTDLNQFHYSPQHSWKDRRGSECAFSLDNARGQIEWAVESSESPRIMQLLVANINQSVIVNRYDEGFDIYICQKCNMSEFEAEKTTQNNGNHPRQSRSQSANRHRNKSSQRYSKDQKQNFRPDSTSRNAQPLCPKEVHPSPRPQPSYQFYCRLGKHPPDCYFPTIQFSVHINRFPLRNNNEQNVKDRIKQILSLFIEFFLAHRITVCYGNIKSEPGPEPHLFFQPNIPDFPSLIMKYSWQMLSINGYRLQLQIDRQFQEVLFDIRHEKNNSDELFYRVCVYLSRICSLKPFLDINQELQHAIDESKRKRDHAAYGLVRKLEIEGTNEVYVPSVTITPTTIRVKPLKLCRTNRVLRATEQFGKPVEHFILVDVRDENGKPIQSYYFGHLRQQLLDYLTKGFALMGDDRQYKYLHHSQSQLRQRQFWFYHHEGNGKNLSFTDAYKWMGNFDKEKNPAKHAARIALCFSTTTATVEVPAKYVRRTDDIKTKDGQYTFTDGCGMMSEELRDQIKKSLCMRRDFSAVQFRYDGAKGVVSVHPDMPPNLHLCIRDSMKKFDSNHECFEVCKPSDARPLFLNQQAILLLSYRQVPDASFLILQQQNHLDLIRALFRNDEAEKQILQKVPSWFLPEDIHLANIDYIHEPFFRQLLISSCLQSMRDLLQRTRIRIPPNEGRNMIGVVDEYNVLKPDEVYIQYTILNTVRRNDHKNKNKTKVLRNRRVVITKNPCHHPGDIRTFTAVDYPQLKHLKDVVVFSQQGDRPAPHSISGSDLDGDEYLVVWHTDLVPYNTENAEPYDFDSGIPSRTYTDSVTRKAINDTILSIAEQDCLGRLCKLHLAFADKFGVDSKKEPKEGVLSTIELAGAISLEVDSPKTGYHPLKENDIKELNNALDNRRPDFMDNRDFEQYKSQGVLGKLYRASKKTIPGWNKLVRYHRHLRHLQVRTGDDSEEDEKEDEVENGTEETGINIDGTLIDDVNREHPGYQECEAFAKELDFVYRQEILEILNLYGLSHESDLWCRNSNARASGELEDTAYTELQQLIARTRSRFFFHQVINCETDKCDEYTIILNLCDTCKKRQRAIAVACYIGCYDGEHALEEAPILSLPWLFASALLQDRLNREPPILEGALSAGMKKTLDYWMNDERCLILNGKTLQFEMLKGTRFSEEKFDLTVCIFIEVLQGYFTKREDSHWPLILIRFIQKILSESSSGNGLDLSDEWRVVLERHNVDERDMYTRSLRSMKWTEEVDQCMHLYFRNIIDICFNEARRTNNIDFLDISESVILLLQKFAINETIY